MEITKELLEQLVSRDGYSFMKIARITGKNVGFISRKAKEFKIASRHLDKIAPRQLSWQTIYDYYLQGRSLDSLKKEYDVPVNTIKRNLKRLFPGIVFRTMDEAKRPAELNDPAILLNFSDEGLSCREIARRLGVKESTVLNAYRRLNVERYTIDYSTTIIPQADLERLYWKDKLPTTSIAKMFGVTPTRVTNLLRQYSLPVRGFGGARKSSHAELNEPDWLRTQYEDLERSMNDIATELKTSVRNISHFLRKYGISIRSKEEVYDKLTGHGTKTKIELDKFGSFECDSLFEVAFLEYIQHIATRIEQRPGCLTYLKCIYYPDFKIDGEFVEVKPKSGSITPGPSRQKLMRQYWVAKRNNIDLRVWNGDFFQVDQTDEDIYYSANWKLNFDKPEECAEWLIQYGFKGVKLSIDMLLNGLSRLREIISSGKDLFNANISAVPVLSLLKHFSQHYFYSAHLGYNSIASAWDLGNRNILKAAIEDMWCFDSNINIYGLVKTINRKFKDFCQVSIFKPWIASSIYDIYLPNGGKVIDPCIGWGGRLLGCIDKNIEYVGFDLNQESLSANTELAKFIRRYIREPILIKADSTICDFPQGDLLFTSPPYDNTEQYSGIDSSKTITAPILNNIFKKFNGIIAINVPRRQEEITISIAKSNGFRLLEIHQMKTASFMGRTKTFEPILIFKRD